MATTSKTDEKGTTYFIEHDGRRARVRFLADGRVRFSLSGDWFLESAYAQGQNAGTDVLLVPRP